MEAQKEYRLSHDFGTVRLNTAKDIHWNLRAKKDLSLSIKAITITGDGFKLITNCPTELPAGQRCVIGVNFTPTTEGPHQGTLIVDLYSEIFIFTVTGNGACN
ncbi:MAG: hypothetical protein ACKOX6_19145 [Bdellovibrio sp.]